MEKSQVMCAEDVALRRESGSQVNRSRGTAVALQERCVKRSLLRVADGGL